MSTDGSDSADIGRRRLLTTGAAALAAGLAGCSGGGNGNGGGDGTETGTGGGGGSASGETEISVTGVWSGGEEEDFAKVISYVESETDVSVEYHPRTTDALLSGTLMDYNSGVAPADIVVMPSPARVRSDGSNGHLEPLGDTWDPENYAVDPDRVSVDGETYAAPFKMDLKPGFWYRESFFEEHDLSEPSTYEEFTSLCAEIAEIEGVDAPLASGGGAGWPLSDLMEAFFLRQENGAELQQGLINGDVDFTDERVRTAFEEVKALHEEDYFSQTREFAVQYEYLWDGSLPLYFMGSWTPAIEAIEDPSDLGVFRLPGTEGMVASINWFTVPAYSDNTAAATTATSAFVSAEGQRTWVEQGGFVASSTQVEQDAYPTEVMAQLPQLANEVTVVPDLDDSLGNPFQSTFWSELLGLWAEPSKDIDPILESLESAQNESLGDG